MHNWLAALLLLPASWRVYGTPRLWLAALRGGPSSFFSTVIKTAPQHVRLSPALWRNLLFYWPMKVGIDLIHSRSVRATLGKVWRLRKKRNSTAPFPQGAMDGPCPGPVTSATLRRMLSHPEIKVVSFDVFDTLLVRPALHPKDIFHVLAARVNSRLSVDFIKMRWNAEEETGLPHPTIHDIYAHIRQKYRLDANTTQFLLDEEIRCEAALLSPREDIKALYDEAVRLGKRIIAISDMYLPSATLQHFLQQHGYTHVDALYVSCEYGESKAHGSLYDSVILKENVHPSEILHMGDNHHADYQSALSRYITAVHCPLPLTQYLGSDMEFAALVEAAVRKDPFWSLLWGFSLHRLCRPSDEEMPPPGDAQNMRRFTALTLAPLLTGYCLSLAGDAALQRAYSRIFFASRDGWLPHQIYSVIGRHMPCIPGIYFHAGRRAYAPLLQDSFFDHVASMEPAGDSQYTLHDLLQGYFGGSELLVRLQGALTAEEKALDFFQHKQHCVRILRRFEDDIAVFTAARREGAQKYYATIFSPQEKRHLVFDLGYSGSVGQALATASRSTIDKLYFWETSANKKRDKALGSTTRTFMHSRAFLPFNLLFEETFSPCAGGVVGFDPQGQPVFEPLYAGTAFRQDMAAIHDTCMEYAEAFCEHFGVYAPHVRPLSGDAAVDVCRFLLHESPFRNMRLLKNIAFPDPLHHTETLSLERKMERFFPQKTVFSGSGFNDPHTVLEPLPPLSPSPTLAPVLGMHIHLHNVALAGELLCYLQGFPAPLDMYVTITDEKAQRTVEHLFSRECLDAAKAVRVLPVPNRGRDIAPWILGMRPYQKDYTLFCHIHAKESPHFDFGVAWRRYLFHHLLSPDMVGNILALFRQRPQLGCLFPPVFPPLAAFMSARGIPPAGLAGESRMASDLLRRMGLQDEICRSELFFPVGSMLWYRPEALRQLFTLPLHLEEFTKEPVGVEGTLAHAIERLPALLAARNGYAAGTFSRAAPKI